MFDDIQKWVFFNVRLNLSRTSIWQHLSQATISHKQPPPPPPVQNQFQQSKYWDHNDTEIVKDSRHYLSLALRYQQLKSLSETIEELKLSKHCNCYPGHRILMRLKVLRRQQSKGSVSNYVFERRTHINHILWFLGLRFWPKFWANRHWLWQWRPLGNKFGSDKAY